MTANPALADVLALPEDAAYPRVVSFARRFGEAHITLAMHAAFPLGLTPELVHLLRVNLVPGAPFIAEADLLLSALCGEAGEGFYEMDAAVRELLLEELVSDPDFGPTRLFHVAEFTLAYAERALDGATDPELRRFLGTQRWAALAQLQPEQASEELMDELTAAREEGDGNRAIRLARITDALSAPLAGQRELTALAANLRGVPAGQAPVSAAGRKAPPPPAPPPDPVFITAKVVVLGDSGVGKSGLSLVLAGQPFAPTDSTHGRRSWVMGTEEVTGSDGGRQEREVVLWDLAGQPGYRLVHQLHLNEVAVALLVFDSRSETDSLAGVRHWVGALAQARRLEGTTVPLRTFLVAARADRGGVAVSRERAQAMVDDLGLDGFFETSAREGWQITELSDAILRAIDWDALPAVKSSALFGSIRQFLLDEKAQGRVLAIADDLYRGFLRTQDDAADDTLRASFETCIGRVESRDLIRRLHFGGLVLLQPELLDAYASALVQAAGEEPDGLGFISEADALDGRFLWLAARSVTGAWLAADGRLADPAQEKLLLIATVEELLRHEIALKESTDQGVDLVFPSQFTRERPDAPDISGRQVTFAFEGALRSVYASLAVRLAHSSVFRYREMWQNAASYTAAAGGTCGIHLRELEEGRGELTLFYDGEAGPAVRGQFETYVAGHLRLRALPGTIVRRAIRSCPNCAYVLPDDLVQGRLNRGMESIRCPVCDETVILLRDEPPGTAEAAVSEMDRSADEQRDRSVAETRLKGKIETGDYDVFLCHNSRDKEQVIAIGERLKERGILPWLDIWEIRPGMRWQQALRRVITSVKAAAVFIGPGGAGPWQELETEALLGEFAQRGKPVIPVILEGRGSNPRLPAFLSSVHRVDMRTPSPDPFEQLVWGITGERPESRRS
jgi:GTPase SAR1 family protein